MGLAVEFVLLYLGTPLTIALELCPRYLIIPVLWVACLYAVIVIRRQGGTVFTWHVDVKVLLGVLCRFVPAALALTLFTWWLYPELFFKLVREHPLLWALLIPLYSLFSVIPQEILFRRFFFFRYEEIFPNRAFLWISNAALFAYVHLVFGNAIAPVFSFIGGLLFVYTYDKNRSLLMVSMEHALYGIAVFSVGLGGFFYHNKM